ncbi:MAG TPA: hypothetical protein VJ787_07810, partial [Thermoleophilia bacterium]|nr:hypothetical protein [Thermoleophilia bacterium]
MLIDVVAHTLTGDRGQKLSERDGAAAFYELVEASGLHALAVVGLVKNAGKTTVVNALMANCARRFGLTSLGLDGERTDHLTGLEKPRIAPPPGTLVATTEGSLARSHYAMRVLEALPYVTSLGRVVIGEASGEGAVEVSGPVTLAEVRGTVERLRALGAEQVLVDGAINRIGSASPRVSDGVVLATGGLVADSLEEAVETTAAALDMLTLPEAHARVRRLVDPEALNSVRALSVDTSGGRTVLELETVVGEGVKVAHDVMRLGTETLFVGGALTQEFLDDLTRVLPPRRTLRVVVRDATVLILPPTAIARCRRRGIDLRVLTPLRVLAVTANPFRLPKPYNAELFFGAV